MERENDSHMDKYLQKHLRRSTAAEESLWGGRPNLTVTLGRAEVNSGNT